MTNIETPQDYTARILSNVRDRDVWNVLASTAGRMRELIAGRNKEDLAWSPEPSRSNYLVDNVRYQPDIAFYYYGDQATGRFRSMLVDAGATVDLDPPA